uniref:Uncharacterized protein n=1 Tax=Anguilla anguilla TaxID=7936 RepID=A0A0E9S879_ANGAN
MVLPSRVFDTLVPDYGYTPC